MFKIYKYPITLENIKNKVIVLPYKAKILSLVNQYDLPILYCLVDPAEDRTKEHTLIVKMTGEEIDAEEMENIVIYNFSFLGTVLLNGDDFVLHFWIK